MIQASRLARVAATAFFSGAACAGMAHAQGLEAGEVVLARYSTVSSMPAANADDPLAAIVHIQFPRSEIKIVGEAVHYLLLRTGYSLVDGDQLDSTVAGVFSRPLPESHRDLGTYSVKAMLEVLMGKSFVLQIDPLRRTVSYVPAHPNETKNAEANVQRSAQ